MAPDSKFAGSHPVRAASGVLTDARGVEGGRLITGNLNSCLMNTGTSFSGGVFP